MTPTEAARRRAASRLLLVLVLLPVVVHAGATRLRPPATPTVPPPPLAVDVGADGPERLSLLPGVGPARAAAIVETREGEGFERLEDLRRVPGIGEVTLRRIREAREVRAVVGPSGVPGR